MNTAPKPVYEFGPFRVDAAARLVTRDGQPISLPPKAFEILLILVRNRGRVVHKDELMQALWPDTFVEDQNLKQNVFLIRRALGEKPHQYCYIASVHGKGYRFVPNVVEHDDKIDEPYPTDSSTPAVGSVTRWPWYVGWVAAVLVFLGAVFAYRIFVRVRPGGVTRSNVSIDQTGSSRQRRSVAVLEIRNLSGHRDDAWLSTAISEMLTTELGAGEQLRTIAGEDIVRFQIGQLPTDADSLSKETLGRIHQALDADFLVLGTYTAVGQKNHRRIRIDLRLQDAVLGETIAEIAQTGSEDDLFALISEAGVRLREKLAVSEVLPAESASVKASLPSSAHAAKLYSEGLARLRIFDPLAARELLEGALKIDPKHSPTHSALSIAWEMLGYDGRARDEAHKAFELAATLPHSERLWTEARFYETAKDWDNAIAGYRTLFNSHPDNLDYGLRLAAADISAGKVNDGLRVIESLRKLPSPARDDPRIDLTEASAAQSLFHIPMQQAAAARAARKGTAIGARLIVAQAKYLEGEAASDLGDMKQSLADFEQAQQLYTAVGDRAGICQALIGIGNILQLQARDRARAKTMFREALQIARVIGEQKSTGRALLDLANVSYDDGKLGNATALYENALTTYRDINDRPGIAGALLNIGLALNAAGDYKKAEAKLQQSLAIAAETNRNFDVTAAYNTLGAVFYHDGRLPDSVTAYENSLRAARDTHFKEAIVDNLAGIGEVMRAGGDLKGAREKQKEALALQDDSLAARLELARIDLEEHNPEVAEGVARKALPKAENDRTASSLLWHTVLAQALLAQGKTTAARDALKRAESLGMKRSKFLDARLDFAVDSARVQAALGHRTQASRMLQAAIAEATKFGDVPYQLEAGLALGEIEAELRSSSAALSRLGTLQRDADDRGFLLIAKKAAAVRASNSRRQPSGLAARSADVRSARAPY